jgi:hypothetical protein
MSRSAVRPLVAVVLVSLAWTGGARGAQEPAPAPGPGPAVSEDELAEALAREGLMLDRAAGVVSLPATVLVKNDLLEYLLVAPNGAAHESLFLTQVRPSLLNAALLLLGAEPGRNAHWETREGVDERGRPLQAVYPPEGDGFYLYAAWTEGGETYLYRVEDLVRNLARGRGLARHRWVYLGSRFAALKPGTPESFLADVEGNLINIAYFFQGNTLLTAQPEECIEQSIWAANEWLLPPTGQPVRLFLAREPLAALAPAWAAALPEADPDAEPRRGPPPSAEGDGDDAGGDAGGGDASDGDAAAGDDP